MVASHLSMLISMQNIFYKQHQEFLWGLRMSEIWTVLYGLGHCSECLYGSVTNSHPVRSQQMAKNKSQSGKRVEEQHPASWPKDIFRQTILITNGWWQIIYMSRVLVIIWMLRIISAMERWNCDSVRLKSHLRESHIPQWLITGNSDLMRAGNKVRTHCNSISISMFVTVQYSTLKTATCLTQLRHTYVCDYGASYHWYIF